MTKSKKMIVWGWILIMLIPEAIVVYGVINFILINLGVGNPILAALNSLVFLIGALSLPGFIFGIILVTKGYTLRKASLIPAPVEGPGPTTPVS